LAANGKSGNATRVETPNQVPYTQTWYDTLGNAVASRDRIGSICFTSYDKAGRVSFEVDPLGYVTGYDRNAFGEPETVTRYAGVTTLNGTNVDNVATEITTARIDAVVNAAGIDHSTDRTLKTDYDQAGRVRQVTEAASYTFDSSAAANQAYDSAGGKTTTTEYNAFGQAIRTRQLVNRLTNSWVDSYQYYDRGGRRTAMVDALGFLTTYDYNRDAKLTNQLEWNEKVTSASTTTYTQSTDPASALDRQTTWQWDKLGRIRSETKVNVSYLNTGTASTTVAENSTADVTTLYAYDGLGQQIWMQAGDGGYTYTSYDTLGRVQAIATPSTGSGLLTGVAQFSHDAHGNVLAKTQNYHYKLNTVDDALGTSGTVALAAGETLSRNATVRSADGRYELMLQADSNLVMRDLWSGDAVIWSSGTAGTSADRLVFQSDGNLVLYAGTTTVWQTSTSGKGAVQFLIRRDGSLALYAAESMPVWASTSGSVVSTTGRSYLVPGQALTAGQSVYSIDGRFRLTLQTDGNLVVLDRWNDHVALWSTNTAGSGADRFVFQSDGNLVLYKGTTAVWSANTAGDGGTKLSLGRNGNLILTTAQSGTVWHTSTSVASSDDYSARVTYTDYDLAGNAIQVQDADGKQHYSSFTIDGKLAKTWQTVTDSSGSKSTLYTAYQYDKLGRIASSLAPSPQSGESMSMSTDYEYNAFGEVKAKGRDGLMREYFRYDNAGRLSTTNSGDGIYKAFLYDLRGNQTAEIRNSGRPGANVITSSITAQTAANWTDTRRVNIKFDALGHVVERKEAVRAVVEGGLTVRKASASASILTSEFWESTVPPAGAWVNTNIVNLTWTSLADLGSGDVRVDLSYTDKTGDGAYVSNVYANYEANAGVQLNWTLSGSHGIASVDQLVVYKRDINGEWQKVIDRSPAAGRPFGDYGTFVQIAAPADPSTQVKLNYRVTGSGNGYTPVLDAALAKFGDSYLYDASSLAAGTYDYEVWFLNHHLTVDANQDGDTSDSGEVMQSESYDGWRRTESGTFVTKADDTGDSAPTTNLQSPTQTFKVDRWGNVTERNDPRQANWITKYSYNRDNQVTIESRPDALYGNQGLVNSPVRQVFYDKMGRQVAVQDERGNVNRQEWDKAGHLVKEIHADSGVVTYYYDAFGQKARMVDALGNDSSDAAFKADHTTAYDYDKLGRLRTTTHGTNVAGSTANWKVEETTFSLTPLGRSNLTESFTYDEAGRKLTQTNGAGETTTYWYDRVGNVIKTQQPMGQVSTVTYTVTDYTIKKTETNAEDDSASWTTNYFGRLTDHIDLGEANYDYAYDAAGQLTGQTNVRNGVAAQNLIYAYDAAGQLLSITDDALDQVTTYAYDLAGHRVRELVERKVDNTRVETLQDNHEAYDTLGRLIYAADNRVQMTMAYDLAGNRTRVQTHVLVSRVGDDNREDEFNADRWFKYDEMNRQTLVDGLANGSINAAQGHQLTYDKNGNRATDKFYGNKVEITGYTYWVNPNPNNDFVHGSGTPIYNPVTSAEVTETYTYDAVGRLTTTDRDGMLVDLRLYDEAGRVVQSGPEGLPAGYAELLNQNVPVDEQIGMEIRKQRYDGNGRLLQQRSYTAYGKLKSDLNYTGSEGSTTLGYDKVGNVKAYATKNYLDTSYTNTSVVTTQRFEGYVEDKTATTSNVFGDGSSDSSYDVNGFLVGINDSTQDTLDRTIANDASGRALRVTQNGNRLYSLMVNGELIGQHGVGPEALDPRDDKTGAVNFEQKAEFEFGYRTITGTYPSAGVGAYVARQGDTLQTIARSAYGDSSQWWRIAQANGLSSQYDVRVGQTLSLPSVVAGSTNTADTFKPYDPTTVVGDTSPNLPIPHVKEHCAGLSMAIQIIVTAVVAIVLSPVLSPPVAAAIGSAAGDTAGQYSAAAFNGRLDYQDLLAAGIGRGGGISDSALNPEHPPGFTGDNDYDATRTGIAAASAYVGGPAGYVVSSVLNEGLGRPGGFSWRGMAASVASNFVSNLVGQGINAELRAQIDAGNMPNYNLGAQVGAYIAKGFIGNVMGALIDPKNFNAAQFWASVIGSLVQGGMSAGSQGSGTKAFDTDGMEVKPSNLEPLEVLGSSAGIDDLSGLDNSPLPRNADGFEVTPSGRVLTRSAKDSGEWASRSVSNTDLGSASASVYPDRYAFVGSPGGGVMPEGGYESLRRARDLEFLDASLTPTLPDGRTGVGIPHVDKAGQVFYQTFDADGAQVGWVAAPNSAAAALPLMARLAPAAEGLLAAEAAFGPPQLKALATGTLLIAGGWAATRYSAQTPSYDDGVSINPIPPSMDDGPLITPADPQRGPFITISPAGQPAEPIVEGTPIARPEYPGPIGGGYGAGGVPGMPNVMLSSGSQPPTRRPPNRG